MANPTQPFVNPFDPDRRESTSSSGSEYLRPNAFAGHRDTLARVLRINSITEGRNNKFVADQSIRSSMSVNMSVNSVSGRILHRIPPEILQLVFTLLSPSDFDAARHTCKQWFRAGMDLALLRGMLRAAQCQKAFQKDVKVSLQTRPDMEAVQLVAKYSPSEEWLIAKRLATTSRLSSDWRGRKGLPGDETQSRLPIAEEVNFRRLLQGQNPHIKTCTVSACEKYVLIVSGYDVFVYRLNAARNSLEAIVRLVADRQVLRVSMDTSSGRFAVAALLESRIGVLWNLNDEEAAGPSILHTGEPMTLGMRTEVHGPLPVNSVGTSSAALPLRRRIIDSNNVFNMAGSKIDPSNVNYVHPEITATENEFFGDPIHLCSTPEDELEPLLPHGGIAVQTRVFASYKNLGSSDDEPRSVAICPQRKCVAFGCRLGIELHWVDALTGGDLSRWFPLAAPSDYLFFLPQRLVDSSKKLRLISSAASSSSGPSSSRAGTMPSTIKERAPTHDRGRRQSMTRLFFGSLPFPSSTMLSNAWTSGILSPGADDRRGVLRTVDCDHYQAIPLSDGFHMLYIDPGSGYLCLGSDAPLGSPSKLIRKIVFTPPEAGGENESSSMFCYNASRDLDWGVSVVSAHHDGRIVLYHVPSDVWEWIRNIRNTPDA